MMKLLDEFTAEDADRLPWSNDLIDFVIASKLLLMTFDKNAPDFCTKRSEVQNKYKELLSNLPAFASNIRKLIDAKPVGSSREQSIDSYNNFNQLIHTAVTNSVCPENIPNFLFDFIKDTHVLDAWDGYTKYARRYKSYLSRSMGGTLPLKKPQKMPGFDSLKFNIADDRERWLFKYLQELINLFYSNGLQCWWAPLFQFANDVIIWSDNKEPPAKENVPVTVDGVLEPIFSRSIEGKATEQPGGNSSLDHLFPEYLLISTSSDSMRKEVGRILTSDFEVILGKWGYHRNLDWKERDFLFLFERLKLRKSVAKIAESHNCADNTVQRNTSKLAKLLFLALPEAAHEFR